MIKQHICLLYRKLLNILQYENEEYSIIFYDTISCIVRDVSSIQQNEITEIPEKLFEF